MIFYLHYILFGGALPPVVVFIAIYLKTYTTASMSEIGALLKIPYFIGFALKPIICGFADRQRAHKLYLMGALAFTAAGFGSLAVPPFFPQFIQQHGRLAWYLNVIGVGIGSSGAGVIWSVGDALAINGAEMMGTSWGYYRMWGVISYALFGSVTSFLNEQVTFLPHMVPGMFLFVALLSSEIVLLSLWPNKYFVMLGKLTSDKQPQDKLESQMAGKQQIECNKCSEQPEGDAQVAVLKLIARHDKSLVCYAIVLAVAGFVTSTHTAYFYLYTLQLCQQSNVRFSVVSSGLLLMHSAIEVLTFLLLPQLKSRFGRVKILTACLGAHCLQQLFHGTYLAHVSPYWALPAESVHGIATAIYCSILAEVGVEIVDRVDCHMPELVERKLVAPGVEVKELKARLRATLHGFLGGCMDGLGGGLGALAGGVVVDHFGFPVLWRIGASLCLMVALVYPSAESWCAARLPSSRGSFIEKRRSELSAVAR